MRQPAFIALVASAFVLYLVASAGAGGVPMDAGTWGLLGVALWSALMPLWVKRDELSRAPELVRLTAAGLSLSLASALAVQAHSLLGELVLMVTLPLFALGVLHLALFVPDTPTKLARHVGSMGFVRVGAIISALLGVLAALPPIWLFDRALIFPFSWSRAPLVFALSALALATVLRVLRRRLGSDTRALSSNVWPTLGLCSALVLSALGLSLYELSLLGGRELRALVAVAAAVLLLGHLWLVSTRRARVAYAWARELWAWGLALATTSFVLIAVAVRIEQRWLVLLPCALLFLLLFELGKHVFRRLARWQLAPQRGELLSAIEEIRGQSHSALSYAELCAEVLRPLRRAAGSPEAAPLVYTLHPPGELRLDAAGFARSSSRPLPEAVRKRLEQSPGLPIIRADVRQVLSRRPELRELVFALDELNALCVLPLLTDGSLDGALVVAQGARRDPLSLEELDALEGLTRFLAPLLSVMAGVERLTTRLSGEERERANLAEKLHDAREELTAAQAELNVLRASTTRLPGWREPVRYSPAMRALWAQLGEAAPQDVPLTLVAEGGTPLSELAAHVHRHSGRKHGPFVGAECASLGEGALAQLCGSSTNGDARRLGLLQVAQGGTLVLYDIAALPMAAQRALAAALSERRSAPQGSSSWYAVDARLIVTTRRPIEELLARQVLCAELARWLSPLAYVVPPLRACPEDLESLALLALDRAGHVLGKNVPGLAPEALAALREHDFPGNHAELQQVIERAVLTASGVRVELADLPPLARGSITVGSFVDQEREILRRALDHAGGNRTRAARALGLKRTTLIEKLRKLGLDEGRGTGQIEH